MEAAHKVATYDSVTARIIPHWRMVLDQGIVTPAIQNWKYNGSGSEDDPYQVTWIDRDPRNPMEFPNAYRWMVVLSMAFSVLGVSLNSSMYSGAVPDLTRDFHSSTEVNILGLSLFVLGFAIGRTYLSPIKACESNQH